MLEPMVYDPVPSSCFSSLPAREAYESEPNSALAWHESNNQTAQYNVGIDGGIHSDECYLVLLLTRTKWQQFRT